MSRATPCAGWDLGDLLTHMTVQHRGFAAAARGHGAESAIWEPETVADAVATHPAGSYAAAAAEVIDAFAGAGVLDAAFALPEFGPGATWRGAGRFPPWITSLIDGAGTCWDATGNGAGAFP